MKHILVATDGSEVANKALMEARELAECKSSKVKIIHVRINSSLPPHIRDSGHMVRARELSQKYEEESLLLLDKALKIFQDFSGEVDAVSRSGDAGEEIIKEAEKGDDDLIIMGNRGLGTFSKALLGSVSNKVLNHANKNVLIITK